MARPFATVFVACLFVLTPGCMNKTEAYGLTDSEVVCGSCSPEYLKAKTAGIMNALGSMVRQVGDMIPRHGKVTFHLDMDQTCEDAVARAKAKGETVETNAFAECRDTDGVPEACDVCFVDSTKQDLASAKSLAGQVLPLHEAGHIWWKGRKNLYNAEEPMVQILSFALSGDANFCIEHVWSGVPLSLVGDLCRLDITNALIVQIYKLSAARAADLGRELTAEELAQVVSNVMGQDMRPSFVTAGII